MDIVTTRDGKPWFQIDSQIGELLLHAFPEAFKRHQKPAAPPAVPLWGTGYGDASSVDPRFTQPYIKVSIMGDVREVFSGPVKNAVGHFKRSTNFDLPEDILKTYKRVLDEQVDWFQKEQKRLRNQRAAGQTVDEFTIERVSVALNTYKQWL